jgi:hypothetical protein
LAAGSFTTSNLMPHSSVASTAFFVCAALIDKGYLNCFAGSLLHVYGKFLSEMAKVF